MNLIFGSVSITRYKVQGKVQTPVIETVTKGLNENKILEIDETESEKAVGWTPLETPFQPDFKRSPVVYENYFIFSLRIDQKKISAKVVNKHLAVEFARRLANNGRNYLSKTEKQLIKDDVLKGLIRKIPATPSIYDVIWNYEDSSLCFFSNLKAANEDLETLFFKSFHVSLSRLFPYTTAYFSTALSDSDRDVLQKLDSTQFIK
jgi:recombination associated protein RdgC